MKKNLWILPALTVLILAGCGTQTLVPPTEETPSTGTIATGATTGTVTIGLTETGIKDIPNYSEELIVNGVVEGEAALGTGVRYTLILEKKSDTAIDRLFVPKDMWNNYLKGKTDAIIGNRVQFKGSLKALRALGTMKNYEVETIVELKKIANPTKEEVVSMLDEYGYCKTDADCTVVYGKCPLPCHIAINKRTSSSVEKMIDNFRNSQENQCTYKCMEIKGVSCNKDHKCEAKQ